MRNKKMYGTFNNDVEYDEEGIIIRQRCVFCGQMKDVADFPKNGKDKNGQTIYRKDCKVCYCIRRNENRNKKRHSDFIGGQKRRGEENPAFTHQDWKNCLIYFGGKCAFCGGTPRKNQRLTKDHLLPVSQGGETIPENIVPACVSCNSSKGAEDFKDWFMKQPFFSQDSLNAIFKWRSIMRQAGEE